MDDYIRRSEAINAIKSLESSLPAKDNYAKGYDAALGRTLIAVREVPPATDIQLVVYAHWIRGEEKGFKTYNPLWYCSNCGGQIRYDIRTRTYQKTKRPVWEVNAFCRKCGAKMIEERSGLDENKG